VRFAGRYRLEGLLGEGGAASTHRAFDEVRGERVALKVLRSGAAALEASLLRELEVLGPLAHPSLAAVLDHGRASHEGEVRAYYAARLVRGPPLTALAERGWGTLAGPLLDVLEALHVLHGAGFRHGDLGPPNILVDAPGRGVLIDLGCAAPLGEASEAVSGTPGFLAPELLEGRAADARADLFAFGRTVEALAALAGPPPEPWRALAARCVAAAPGDRPSEAAELLEALGEGRRLLFGRSAESGRLVGRDAELARGEAILGALLSGEPGSRVLAVDGPPGSGRSRLLAALKRSAQPRCEVVEIGARRSDGLTRWLGPTAPGVEGALDRLGALRAEPEPRLWVMDDADQLDPADCARLAAIARALEPGDPIALFVVGLPDDVDGVERCRLGPLDEAAVARWAEGKLDPSAAHALHAASGGQPAAIRRLLAHAMTGASIERIEGDVDGASLEALDPEARRTLAALAAHEVELGVADLEALGVPADVTTLAARGWVRERAGGVALARPADAPAILALAPPEDIRALHRALAARFDRGPEAVRHRARSGDVEGALARLPAVGEAAGARWRAAARALKDAGDPRARLEGARRLAMDGALDEAAEALRGLVDAAPFEARLELGRALLRLERASEALDVLREAEAYAASDADEAHRADAMARAHIKLGAYREALEVAQPALSRADGLTSGALAEDVGVACSYLGRPEADGWLREAARRLEGGGRPRDRVRVESYLAIDAYRRGDLDAARDGYAAALSLVEAHGLDEQLAHAALNVGTVQHQRGALADARAAYHRAERVARALGQRATLATARFDLAQLYADLGAWDRAADAVERAEREAADGGFRLLLGGCAMVRAQIALHAGRDADAPLAEARRTFEALGAARELHEVALLEAEVMLGRGALDDAEARLASVDAAGGDVAVRRRLLVAACLRARGDEAGARRVLEEALAEAVGPLAAEAHAALAASWEASGGARSAETHAAEAERRCERMASGLPAGLVDAFWAHPRRAALRRAAPIHEAAGGGIRERQLERLLALNRQLGSSLAVDDVCRQALDAAIELTGAERGYVLRLEEGGALTVAVARNLDRAGIDPDQLAFSRSIAERAIEAGEVVMTLDALADARFAAHRSVHAMKLRSVMAVPIPSPRGVAGALYLDNRFLRGRFAEVDREILVAFADQVAIALENARLHEELARRADALDAQRARIEALSRGQAARIEALESELWERQRALERRYDYAELVADAPAMQPVLATLDRVIDSPLAILVTGESGTGKELVARAIHFNGPRKAGPFVTVNCAALPETLLESELFGHVKGAFTGAERDKPGLMVAASGGTLFLDELGETSPLTQAKLLRALETREVRPVGGDRAVPVDFRLVSATNRDLREEVEASRFREDLYYRIGVVELRLPPLRERLEDLPALCRRVLDAAAEEMGRPAPKLSPEALAMLSSQRWPGNVRELQNALRGALVLADGDTLAPAHFALRTRAPRRPAESRAEHQRREKSRILRALEATGWNVSAAARELGMGRATLYRKLALHGVPTARERSGP